METHVGSRTAVLLVLLQFTYVLAPNVLTYFGPGGTLSLSPSAVQGPIRSILWRHKENLVAEWIKDAIELQYYGMFRNRTELNRTTGHLKITRATEADTGVFKVEINNVAQADGYEARMVQNVPDLSVWVKPGPNPSLYVLYCDPVPGQEAALEAAEPVSYRWKIGTADWVEFGNKLEINVNETTLQAETFTCQMVNPVSEKSSKPEQNPFYGQALPAEPGPLALGLSVALAVALLVVVGFVFAYKKKKFPFNQNGNAPVSPSDGEMETKELNPEP